MANARLRDHHNTQAQAFEELEGFWDRVIEQATDELYQLVYPEKEQDHGKDETQTTTTTTTEATT